MAALLGQPGSYQPAAERGKSDLGPMVNSIAIGYILKKPLEERDLLEAIDQVTASP